MSDMLGGATTRRDGDTRNQTEGQQHRALVQEVAKLFNTTPTEVIRHVFGISAEWVLQAFDDPQSDRPFPRDGVQVLKQAVQKAGQQAQSAGTGAPTTDTEGKTEHSGTADACEATVAGGEDVKDHGTARSTSRVDQRRANIATPSTSIHKGSQGTCEGEELSTINGKRIRIPIDPHEWPHADHAVGFVPVSAVELDPDNPRVWMDIEGLAHLRSGLLSQGCTSPIVVMRVSEHGDVRYRCIAGNRQLKVHLESPNVHELAIEIQVRVFASKLDRFITAVVDNEQEPLCDRDMARALTRIFTEGEFKNANRLAQHMGMSPVFVGNMLAIGSLPEAVLELMDPELPLKERLLREPAVALGKLEMTPGSKASLAQELLTYVASRKKRPTAPQQATWLQNKAKVLGAGEGKRNKRSAAQIARQLRWVVRLTSHRRRFLGDNPAELPFADLLHALAGGDTVAEDEFLEALHQACTRLGIVLEGLHVVRGQGQEEYLRMCPPGHVPCSFYRNDDSVARGQYVPVATYQKLRNEGRLVWQRWGQERPEHEPTEDQFRVMLAETSV